MLDLDKRLQAADEKIDNFNVEETHFGWETTVYPLKMELVKQLTPYLRLYEITVEFNEKYKYKVVNNLNVSSELPHSVISKDCTFSYIHSLIHSTRRRWMDGPRAGVDPDQVEEDVMGYYRNIYKLEKQFEKEPNPKNIAVKVFYS